MSNLSHIITTPRTDERVSEIDQPRIYADPRVIVTEYVDADFARCLEQELACGVDHVARLEAENAELRKDRERLDKLIDLTGCENSDGSWSVTLNWDNYQDQPQVVKDGEVIGCEICTSDEEEEEYMSSPIGVGQDLFRRLFRRAIDKTIAAMDGDER